VEGEEESPEGIQDLLGKELLDFLETLYTEAVLSQKFRRFWKDPVVPTQRVLLVQEFLELLEFPDEKAQIHGVHE